MRDKWDDHQPGSDNENWITSDSHNNFRGWGSLTKDQLNAECCKRPKMSCLRFMNGTCPDLSVVKQETKVESREVNVDNCCEYTCESVMAGRGFTCDEGFALENFRPPHTRDDRPLDSQFELRVRRV